MGSWGEGYKEGHKDTLAKVILALAQVKKLPKASSVIGLEIVAAVYQAFENVHLSDLSKDKDGDPSQYAVANKCCGGVDAHTPGCRG